MASIEGVKRDNTDGNYNGDLVFKTRSHNGNNIERMRLNDGGLKFPSGQGINFSANTAGGGTSSATLLEDYEEGSYSSSIVSSNVTLDDSSATGYYIKVGN